MLFRSKSFLPSINWWRRPSARSTLTRGLTTTRRTKLGKRRRRSDGSARAASRASRTRLQRYAFPPTPLVSTLTPSRSSAGEPPPQPENRLQGFFTRLATHYSLDPDRVRAIFYYADLDPKLCAQVCSIYSRRTETTGAEFEVLRRLWTPEEDEKVLEGRLRIMKGEGGQDA